MGALFFGLSTCPPKCLCTCLLSSVTHWAWQSLISVFSHALPPHIVFLTLKKNLGYLMCRSAQTWPGRAALTMEESNTSPRSPWGSAGRCHLSANQKKLKNSQSEKKSVFCICCIWVRFNPATNENKASWNCAWTIFRKFSFTWGNHLSSEHQSSTKSKSSPVLMLQQIHNALTQAMTTWLQLENISQIISISF